MYRSGMDSELVRGNCIYQCGRIEPIALRAQPAVAFAKNSAREHYQLPLLSIDVRSPRIASISLELRKDEQQPILLFALGAEEA